MQKFTNLKNYLLELSFLALLVRIICFGAGIGEALVFVSLVVSMGYNKWLTKTNEDKYLELKNQMEKDREEYLRKFDNITAKFSSQSIDKSYKKQVENEQESPFKKRAF